MAATLVSGILTLVSLPGIAQQFGPASSDLFEEHTEKLIPKKPRSELDEDRIAAAAQFAYGRMLLQREQTADALSRFERAFRNDPSPTIAREIMATASELNRHAEAVRYAILAAEVQASDGDLAIKLAGFLAERGQNRRAMGMLEQAAKATRPPRGFSLVLLQAEKMRLSLLTDKPDEAAKSAEQVQEALRHPDRAGMSAAEQSKLLSQRERLETLIAESYLRAHRHADAEAMFREAHKARPNERLLGIQLARLAVDQKDWKKAREQLEIYFRNKATSSGFEPYELLTQIIAAEVPDESKAKVAMLTALRQLRESDPTNNALAYFTAEKLLTSGDLAAAAKLYEELLVRQPTATAYRQLAQIYRQQKEASALLRLVGRAIEQSSSRNVLGPEGDLIVRDSSLFDQLVGHARKWEPGPMSPPQPSTFVGVSLFGLAGGKIDIAREFYNKAIAVPQADLSKIRETIGIAALLAEQSQFGAEIFEQAIAAKPAKDKLATYYYYLAGAYEFAGETDKALSAADKCANLNRDSVQFQSRRAWVLYHAKRLEEAEKLYRELIAQFDRKFDNEDVRDQLKQTRLLLSNLCVLEKRLPEAEEWLEQVLDEFPEDVGALNDLGYLWADQGKRLQRAVRMVEQAVASDPDNAAYRDSLGWAYYRLGRFQDAVRELERAVATTPDGVIYDHLGDAYWKLPDRAKAIAAWRKAADLMKDPHEASARAMTIAKIQRHSGSQN